MMERHKAKVAVNCDENEKENKEPQMADLNERCFLLFISIFLAAGVVWCYRRAGTTAKQKAEYGHQKLLFTRDYSTGHMKTIC